MDLPSIHPNQSGAKIPNIENGSFGVQNTMIHGFQSVKADISSSHPLELSEQTYNKHRRQFNYSVMKCVQGLHAPLRLMYERKAAAKIQRLPFLPSSNVMLDVLDGTDEMIRFDDVLNDRMQPEVLGTPHMIMERKLGFL